MMKLHKIILSFLLIVLMVIIAGCGKLGEDEAENMVKSHLKVKDSYKKIAYDVNESAKVSKLVYKAKNLMGVEIEDSVYFDLSKDNMIYYASDSHTPGIEFMYQEAPEKMVKYAAAYDELKEAIEEHGFHIHMYLESINSISNELHDNYFGWRECFTKQNDYNQRVRSVQKAWKKIEENATDSAKQSIITDSSFKLFYGKECINAKEIEVNLSGDFMSWQGNYQFKN